MSCELRLPLYREVFGLVDCEDMGRMLQNVRCVGLVTRNGGALHSISFEGKLNRR